ncbi:MAG: alpha/beta hydrolase [Verrucomicrobiota bacterium]
MPALSIAPALSVLAVLGRVPASRPLRTWLRTTGYKLRPPRPLPYVTGGTRAVATAGVHEATLLHEARSGDRPTIVLGGFVPDAPEQVFLLRGDLLRHGSVHYFNYPKSGFDLDRLCVQLDELVQDLAARAGTPPVILAVSFGAGLAIEWLRRIRAAGRSAPIAGLVLISPVTCVADLIAPGSAKPTTLLGRAILPYLADEGEFRPEHIERSRSIFVRMFEAGAQNKSALAALMTRAELLRLRDKVIATINGIDRQGASARIRALCQLPVPTEALAGDRLPLCEAPTLILYAEKENAVLQAAAPGRFLLTNAHRTLFPDSNVFTVSNSKGDPVQHASLIFHYFDFRAPIVSFYARLKGRKLLQVA